jgi:hypothetical protein
MKTKNSPRCRLRLARMALSFLLPGLLLSCEGGDVSLQKELAELRERIRRSEQERDQAIRQKNDEADHRLGLEIHPVAVLQAKFEEAAKRLEEDVVASFPGYRPAALRRGKFIYVFDEEEPYRISLELSLRPNATSAQTPEVPPISFEARGTADGEWKMPGQPALREMQAAASARAASQSSLGRRAQEQPSPFQSPGDGQSSKGYGARVINWDERGAPPSQPSRPTDSRSEPAPPGSKTPRASESYEIRFRD